MVIDIPTIQPFTYQASTAFQERVQLADKLNEVIDALNNLGDLPDLESQITELNSKVAELEESIGNTDTSLAELENQVNGLISEVNTTIKQSISALESEVDGIDTRLTTAEGTISEHGTEIDGLLKEVIDSVVMTSNPHGTVQVQINHEDGSNDISAPIDLGLVEEGGIVLRSGTTDRSFKLIVTLTDGTSWQTNDFVIPEGGGTEVSVTSISIAQGTGTDKIQVRIGLSDGSTISSNDWTVVTPSEFSALGTRVTTAEGNITKNTGDISDLDTRVQAIEDSPGYALQPATATTLGGVKIGANVKVQADGTISVDLSSYALKTEIPDVSVFVTAEDVAADYQPKGNYLTTVPIGGTAIGGVKNGGNVTIDAQGNMNAPTTPAYTLPVGGTALGGVKNGGNVTIDAQGNMNAPTTPAYTLPVASATTLGGVKIGSGVNVSVDGTISVKGGNVSYTEISDMETLKSSLSLRKMIGVALRSNSRNTYADLIIFPFDVNVTSRIVKRCSGVAKQNANIVFVYDIDVFNGELTINDETGNTILNESDIDRVQGFIVN